MSYPFCSCYFVSSSKNVLVDDVLVGGFQSLTKCKRSDCGTQRKMNTKKFLIIAFLFLCLTFKQVAANIDAPQTLNQDSPMGSNLSVPAEWSAEYIFTNPMFQSSDWLTQNWSIWNTKEHHLVDFDENGWPRSLPTGNGVEMSWIATTLFQQIGEYYPAGEYVVTYEGEGTVEYGYDARKDEARSANGRDVVNVTPGETPLGFLLKITQTDPNGTGDYIRNIRVEMPNVDVSQQFHPHFLQNIRKYKTIRMMDWQRTNWNAEGPVRGAEGVQIEPIDVLNDATENPYYNARPTENARGDVQLLEWSERPLPTDVRYTSEKGMPVEVMIDLVNELNADVWFNMPHHASDDYMAKFAELTEARLNAGQRVYIEYSNEVWNDGFYQSEWVKARGEEMWPESNESGFKKLLSYYGVRSAEMCNIWKAAFSTNPERVICVIATQSANPWVGEQMLDCPLWDNAPCHAYVDAVAVAPYFGQHIGHPANYAVVREWLNEADGGLTKLFEELEHGTVLQNSSIEQKTLPLTITRMSDYRDVADSRDLSLVAYEGGQHLVGVGSPQWDDALATLFAEANRDPRMAALYTTYFAAWHNTDGEMFVNFNSVSRYSRWGNWGAQEHNLQEIAVKRDAIETHIANTPCDWAACEPIQLVVPTAVNVAQLSTQNTQSSLLVVLASIMLTMATCHVYRASSLA